MVTKNSFDNQQVCTFHRKKTGKIYFALLVVGKLVVVSDGDKLFNCKIIYRVKKYFQASLDQSENAKFDCYQLFCNYDACSHIKNERTAICKLSQI